jgi:hypothetical protein
LLQENFREGGADFLIEPWKVDTMAQRKVEVEFAPAALFNLERKSLAKG